jgi:hypothetical protein
MSNQETRAQALKRLEDYNVREQLAKMEIDASLKKPRSTYSANTTLYPDNQMPFIDKHISYLLDHPALDPLQYLSNLRLMMLLKK